MKLPPLLLLLLLLKLEEVVVVVVVVFVVSAPMLLVPLIFDVDVVVAMSIVLPAVVATTCTADAAELMGGKST